ncbi:MAG: O-antigen ligase family protein [Ramlibacter sp.]
MPRTGTGSAVAAAAALLALTMALAPAVGAPNEFLLQDTLKSMLVSFAALAAALLFFWGQRGSDRELHWHAVLWLPLLLMAYALGSMAWSHAYLGGVEAIRWFVFSLLLWLGLQTFSRERLPWLACGVHAGALVASLWAALQFWVDLRLFPQGPNPASTFVNRNFFAEFVVCTLPFSFLLLARMRRSASIALLAASNGFVIVAILMTGTRAALIALWLLLLVVLPLVAWRCRASLGAGQWSWPLRALALGALAATVVGLGAIPTGNAKIVDEGRGQTALERGLKRTASISPDDVSLNVREVMWRATLRVIADRPLTGVGAGAWEVQIPRYQADGEQLETDYYVHNEVLQLLAEDGIAGWVFLAGLFAYLLRSAWVTWKAAEGQQAAEAPWRATALASLLALLIVSNVGFPWRMASTGALFALSLAVLAASDVRFGLQARLAARPLRWRRAWTPAALGVTAGCLALAVYIAEQAAECESKIVRATQIALTISASGDWDNPRWNGAKQDMLRLTREAVAINPHYRKITPMIADELARWNDWQDATWIWESVLQSRPYIVAILTNVARGYGAREQWAQAAPFLERARRISPDAPAVLSLEVILLSRTGREKEATQLARESVARGRYDADLLNAAFVLGWRGGDLPMAEQALKLRMRDFPATRIVDALRLGSFYLAAEKDETKALQAWREALVLAGPANRAAVLQQVPAAYRDRLGT